MVHAISERQQIFQEIRTRLSDVLTTEEHQMDTYLAKWLEALDYDVNKTVRMIRASIAWRKENKMDSLLQKQFSSYLKTNYPFEVNAVDRKGNPVIAFHLGNWDIKQALQKESEEIFTEYTMSIFEHLAEAIRKTDEARGANDAKCLGCTVLIDFEGYSYSQLISMQVVQFFKQIATNYEANYPGLVCKMIFFNCPRLFSFGWKVIKMALSQRTQDILLIRGSKRSEWEADIREIIDPNQIKIQFGGNLAY